MDAFNTSCTRSILGAVAVLAVSLLAGGGVETAHAQIGCRSDPIALLSDGTQLDLSAVIKDRSHDVQQVAYTLHVPRGTSVVAFTPGILGPKVTHQVIADNSPDAYETIVQVTTSTSGIPVTTSLEALRGLTIKYASTSGYAGQNLTVNVTL